MKICKLVLIITASIMIASCKSIEDINNKPERISSSFDFKSQESEIGVRLNVDLSEVESVVNNLLKDPITGEENGEFSETYTLKTNDPLYHPNKWIKTKDPLYQPSKWLKACAFGGCVKTKNPTYHPNKWIKTKDPLYHPNEWIKTSAKVDIGYKAKYNVSLSEPISFQAYDSNRLKIDVPISVDGKAGFRGDLAKIGMVDNKNFDADVTFSFIVGIEFSEDWCPALDVTPDIDWRKGPKIEIIGGVWLDLNLAAELSNLGIEPEIKKSLESLIDCSPIKQVISKTMIPSSVKLSDDLNGIFLEIRPVNIYKPKISFSGSDISIDLATKLNLGISNNNTSSQPQPLPPLADFTNPENLIKISVPIEVGHIELEQSLDSRKGNLSTELNKKIVDLDTGAVKSIEIQGFEIYPNEERIAIGVEFSLKTGFFLKPKGTIYLTSKPVISKDNVLTLTDVQINSKFENSSYDLALSILKEYLENKIEELVVLDLGSEIDEKVSMAMLKLSEQLSKVNEVSVDIIEPAIDLSSDIVNIDDSMIKSINVVTGVEIRPHPIEVAKTISSQ